MHEVGFKFGSHCTSGTETGSTSYRGRIVELACNCYGCHVLQKALDCEEEVRLLIVSELLLGDPAQTLVNKHASHVWSKVISIVVVRSFKILTTLADYGTDLDASRTANLYIVRSFLF